MVLVTFVVIGHSWGLLEKTQGSHWAYDFLYLWHIPAFVFVSGYLSKSFEWDRRHMKSLVYTLLVPYLIFEPALYYYRVGVVGETEPGTLWLEPHWTMWYLVVLMMWRLVTPILKLHWLFLPLSVFVSVLGGFWNTDLLMLPRFLGLLPFFVLGLHLKPRHLRHLDDVWVRIAAVPALVGMAVAALFTDAWAQTAFLWYDAGYEDVGIDPVIAFQTRLTVMTLGLVGAFSVLALVPRRSLGLVHRDGRRDDGRLPVPRLRHQDRQGAGLAGLGRGAHHRRLRAHHPRCRRAGAAAGLPPGTPRARAVHQPAGLVGVASLRPARSAPAPSVGARPSEEPIQRVGLEPRRRRPPRWAGCHGAGSPGRGAWCGRPCSPSSSDVIRRPRSCVQL